MKSNIFAHYFLKPNKGFTLIEIAIILTALGIFVSIAAIAVQSLTPSGKINQNRKILAEYDLSVRGFLVSNYRIVCPDMDDDGKDC
jgi:Tfp pilus assembly protein PilE